MALQKLRSYEEPEVVSDRFLFEKGVLYENQGHSFIQVVRNKKIKTKSEAIEIYLKSK